MSAAGFALALAHGSALAQLTKDEQGCINAMNKALGKVAKTQGKEGSSCVKNASKGKEANPQACLTADPKDKVSKAKAKTLADETKKCSGAVVGYTSGATVNQTAGDNELALMEDIFGADLDPVISTNKLEGGCQAAVIKRVQKIVDTKLKEFGKCKKAILKAGADTAGELEDCVDNPGQTGSIADDEKGKIGKAITKLGDDITKKCPGVNVAATFPGECSGSLTAGCLDALAECRVCLMINEADGLNVDCTAFSGIPCPPGATNHKCTLESSFCDSGTDTCTVSGDPCTQDSDCGAEASNLQISTQLFAAPALPLSGAIDIDCGDGTLDGNGKADCTCTIQNFDGVVLAGIGTACITDSGQPCPTGEIDCDGGNILNWHTQGDHNAGACTSNADCAADCTALCAPNPVLESGCENFCEGGANNGLPCTDDSDDCPGGACNGPDGGAHGNVCGCQCLTTPGAASAAGDMACQLPTKIQVILPAGSPCTDPPDIDLPPVCIPLTTAAASGTITSANNGGGSFGNSASGINFTCPDIFSSTTSGAEIVGVVNFFDSTLGDLSVAVTSVCQ
jgi:hypothetical protein